MMEKLNELIDFYEMTGDEPELLVMLLELRRHRADNWKGRAEAAEAKVAELETEQAEHDEQLAVMEGKFNLALAGLRSKNERLNALQAQLDTLAKQEPIGDLYCDISDGNFPCVEFDGRDYSLLPKNGTIEVFARAALTLPVRVPDGFKLVPVEPTPVMLAAIKEAGDNMRGSHTTYSRLLAAAPEVE